MSEEDLVNCAFEVLGGLLSTSEFATRDAVPIMMNEYGLTEDTAVEVIAIAFERWVEVYAKD